jgi:hypothetical protein
MPLTGRVGRHTSQAGRHAQNRPEDQLTIINLLNNIPPAEGGPGASLSKSVRSGICSDELYRAISTFEDKQFPGQRSGYVDPDGAMLQRMEALAAKTAAAATQAAARAIRFVTPEQYLGPPTGKTKDISNTTFPMASNDVLWVGLTGDSQNIVKTVGVNIPGAVTIAEGSTANNIRWLRLSKPQGSKAQVQAKDGTGQVIASFELDIIELPKGPGTIDFEVGPDGTLVHTPPKARTDYIDNRMEGIGYNIYLGGCQVYCKGMSTPIFVSNDFLKLDVDKAEAINSTIFDTLEKAKEAIMQSPAMATGVTPFAFYQGAGGAVIAPTIFSPATTPRIIATYYEARRLYSDYVVHALVGVAIGIAGGIATRMILGRISRALSEDPTPPPRSLPAPVPPRIRPVNDTVNVGGAGEVADVTNLNPIKPGSGGASSGIPNHVPLGMEKMDSVFEAGSVKKMISNRLRYVDVDWQRGTEAAANVMPSGSRVSMNVWTQSQQEVDALKAAFQGAGFTDVQIIGPPGPGTLVQAVRR